jgi:hypothetical protein
MRAGDIGLCLPVCWGVAYPAIALESVVKKTKRKHTNIDHTQEGTVHGHEPAAKGKGEQKGGK